MILSGTKVADKVLQTIRTIIAQHQITPKLGIVLVGADPASQLYVKRKSAVAASVGIAIELHEKTSSTTEELITLVNQLNNDPSINGILVQLPLPPNIETQKVIDAIKPPKDIDGFHPDNIKNYLNSSAAQTPVLLQAVTWLLQSTDVDLKNKTALLIGKSDIFLQPMSAALQKLGLLVSWIKPEETSAAKTQTAEVLVVAVGRPQTITKDGVRPGAIIIDIGINRLANGHVVGDTDFAALVETAAWITPTPGGVGPVTIAAAMWNTLLAALHDANITEPKQIITF